MKHLVFALFVSLLISSCSRSTKKLTKDLPMDLSQYSKSYDSLFSIPDSILSINETKDPCDPEHRQILTVTNVVFVQGSYKPDSLSKPDVGRYILLTGKPSPSSCKYLTAAYLHFVSDKSQLRTPTFSVRTASGTPTSAELRLFYLDSQFEAIQAQLSSANEIYCWRGVFGHGHIWSDIHTGRTLPSKP